MLILDGDLSGGGRWEGGGISPKTLFKDFLFEK